MNEELLTVLRGRCLPASLDEAPRLLAWLRANWSPLAECQPTELPGLVRQVILDAATRHLEPSTLLPVVQIMLGGSVDDPARITRTRILQLMAQAMPRHRTSAGGSAYSPRRMEQLERELICPAVERALRLFLGRTARPDQHPWLDYDLTITLRRHSSNPELVTMRTTMEFTAHMRRMQIAVTTDEALADGICQERPEITEVFVPSAGWSLEMLLASVRKDDRWISVPLRERASEEVREWLGQTGLENRDVRLYQSEDHSDGRAGRWRIVSDQEVSIATRYCYWSAARPLFLRKVFFDYSAFPEVHQRHFELKPRLGRRIEVGQDQNLQVIELEVGSWVSPGNALELTWKDRSP